MPNKTTQTEKRNTTQTKSESDGTKRYVKPNKTRTGATRPSATAAKSGSGQSKSGASRKGAAEETPGSTKQTK
jgi:hypothetical protein